MSYELNKRIVHQIYERRKGGYPTMSGDITEALYKESGPERTILRHMVIRNLRLLREQGMIRYIDRHGYELTSKAYEPFGLT